MKRIFFDFVEGDSTKKLSIISDFSTILGVSVATFVAGPFLSEFTEKKFIVSDFIISIAFYFIFISFVAEMLYSYATSLYKYIKENKFDKATGSTLLALFVAWVLVTSFPYAKYYFGNAFNVSYLLPVEAEKAIKVTPLIEIEKHNEVLSIAGKITVVKGANPSDYVVIGYSRNSDGLYEIIEFGGLFENDYLSTVSNSGKFVIPLKLKGKEHLDHIYLVVYRKSDWSFLSLTQRQFGYPSVLTQLPNEEIEKIGGFTWKVKI